MTENINKIWATSEPLSDLFERIIFEIKSALPEQITAEPDFSERLDKDPTLRSLNNLAKTFAENSRYNEARRKAAGKLRNLLVSGEVSLVGRLIDQSRIVQVKDEFWIAAEISRELNQAELGDVQLDELRVIGGDNQIPAAQIPQGTEVSPNPQYNKKIPTAKQIKALAIEACFRSGAIDFSDHNVEQRMGHYRAWIQQEYPPVDVDQTGYGRKSWEADETAFKHDHGMIAPKK